MSLHENYRQTTDYKRFHSYTALCNMWGGREGAGGAEDKRDLERGGGIMLCKRERKMGTLSHLYPLDNCILYLHRTSLYAPQNPTS